MVKDLKISHTRQSWGERGLGFNQSDESDRVPLVSKNKDDDDFQLWKQDRNGVVSPTRINKTSGRVGSV